MSSSINDIKISTNQSLLQKTGKTQAAFVPKLFIMVRDMRQPTPEDPNPERPLISWSKSGDVFCVFDPIEFSRVILPLHFKHNNWQSFVRQLNMYGFHKVNDLLSSHCNPDTAQAWEFRHPHFKRDRPDLLPMIKRKSTKHHGSSKAANGQVKVSASSQAGEARFHHQLRQSDGFSARNSRSFQAYAPHHHPGSALPMANRPLHGEPPPPVLISKINALPRLSARPPVLQPLITHQMQYPHTSHRKLKSFSAPPLKLADINSSSTPPNTCKSSVMLSSPPSAQPSAHTFHPTISPYTQPIEHHVQEDEFNQRNFVDAWRGKPEAHRNESALGRVEDELRRLNGIINHRDVIGNHMFSVLGLLVELVTLLANSQVEKNPPDQQKILLNYVQAAKDAIAKLDSFNHDYRDAGSKNNGTSLSDSMSPVSTDLTERLTLQPNASDRTSADSKFPKSNDPPISPSCVVRSRYPDRLNSSQFLPPLRTIMENWQPPILKRTDSSGPLPASINRLMNDDRHENSSIEISSASDENAADNPEDLIKVEQDEHNQENQDDIIQDDHEDRIHGDGGEDDSEEEEDGLQDDLKTDEEEGNLNDESEHEETQAPSADGHQSASYHLSDTTESPIDNIVPEFAAEFQRDYQRDRSDLIPVKRPSAQLMSILWSTNESTEKQTDEEINAMHPSRKRTRVVGIP